MYQSPQPYGYYGGTQVPVMNNETRAFPFYGGLGYGYGFPGYGYGYGFPGYGMYGYPWFRPWFRPFWI